MNSTSQDRLQQLQSDLKNPANLICIKGTMHHSEGAMALMDEAMQKTGGLLHHVVGHCGVRWWGNPNKNAGSFDDSAEAVSSAREFLQSQSQFAKTAGQEPLRHFLAAKLLLPKLRSTPSSSHIFLTGGAGDRSVVAQVNAHAVWGLAKGLRQQPQNASIRMIELRSNLSRSKLVQNMQGSEQIVSIFNRSADLGEICAGMAASKFGSRGLHHLNTFEDVDLFKSRFPCPRSIEGLPDLFTSNELPSAKPYA
jgi:hypothetical protein